MTQRQKEKQLRKKILWYISQNTTDIPIFILKEIEKILKYLNFYKLQNLYLQIDEFCEFIQNLSENHHKQIFKNLK